MNYFDLIREKFGIILPISGGSGRNIDDPLLINHVNKFSAVFLEYDYLKYMAKCRNIEYQRTRQVLLFHNERIIDLLYITITEGNASYEENYYFDISESYRKDDEKND